MPMIGEAAPASSVDKIAVNLLTNAHPVASVRAKKSSPAMTSAYTPDAIEAKLLTFATNALALAFRAVRYTFTRLG